MANVKIILEAEISDEVLGKLFEGLKIPKPEEAAAGAPKIEIPRVVEIEVSEVGGKLTARLLTEEEVKKEEK
ncbi:MAG: hypothetical protein GSR80_000946 [Desulfurococcales archaeon]|nr:hypothetical protein [Desulfurococcales archaeon]